VRPRPLGWCPHGRLILRPRARQEQPGRCTASGRGLATIHVPRQRTNKRCGGTSNPPKDVKNEGRSGNVYENKGLNDRMTENSSGICAWLESFLQNWTTIHRSFWQKMQRLRDNWGEARIRIGSSVHRASDPWLSNSLALDGPISRSSQGQIFAALAM